MTLFWYILFLYKNKKIKIAVFFSSYNRFSMNSLVQSASTPGRIKIQGKKIKDINNLAETTKIIFLPKYIYQYPICFLRFVSYSLNGSGTYLGTTGRRGFFDTEAN